MAAAAASEFRNTWAQPPLRDTARGKACTPTCRTKQRFTQCTCTFLGFSRSGPHSVDTHTSFSVAIQHCHQLSSSGMLSICMPLASFSASHTLCVKSIFRPTSLQFFQNHTGYLFVLQAAAAAAACQPASTSQHWQAAAGSGRQHAPPTPFTPPHALLAHHRPPREPEAASQSEG